MRGKHLKINDSEEGFKVHINGGFTPQQAKNIAIYCVSEKIPFEDNVTHYQPTARDIKKLQKNIAKYEIKLAKKEQKAAEELAVRERPASGPSLSVASRIVDSEVPATKPKHGFLSSFSSLFKRKNPINNNEIEMRAKATHEGPKHTH